MKAIFTLLLLMITNIVFASEVGYEVEVIIFEDTTGIYKHSEKWPELIEADENQVDTEEIKTIESKEIVNKNTKAIIVENIIRENYRLNKQAEILEKHPDYRILVHKAWKQPGLDKVNALPMQLINKVSSEKPDNIVKSYIDGDITLIMSRYLHINTNLTFHRFVPTPFNTYSNTENDSSSSFKEYPLIFERRMRSKEIHYIDHPLVGIIVLAVPFKIETEEDKKPETYNTLQ